VKVIPVALATKRAARSTTEAAAILIERQDGQTFGFTSSDRPLVLDGVTYSEAHGIVASALEAQSSWTPANMEVTTLDDGTIFDRDDVIAGKWRGAEFTLFRYDFKTKPATMADVDVMIVGKFGGIRPEGNQFRIELRDIRQWLQQQVGAPSQKTCRNRLGVMNVSQGSWCPVYLSPLIVTAQVGIVVSAQEFYVPSIVSADDYHGNGILRWQDGLNEGLSTKIKIHEFTSNGARFVLDLPMYLGITPGDEFTVEPGCRLRKEEDCRDKWDAVLGFNGEPDRPKPNDVLQPPVTSL
jgi:uncharacterized phage protein (TIGR02218 family)